MVLSGYGPGIAAKRQKMNIYSYTDYRQFIKARVEELRKRIPKLSIRELLRRVGCTSPSYYKEVILDGKIKMSLSKARDFAAFFNLSGTETAYLLLLVQYTHAKTQNERIYLYEQMLKSEKPPPSATDDRILTVNEYAYLSNWYLSAIREVLQFYPGFGNRNREERLRLSRFFCVKMTEEQICEAIDILERLGFIAKNEAGNYRKTAQNIRSVQKTPAAYKTLCHHMQMAQTIINTAPPASRVFKTMVLSMTEETYLLIENKINELSREIYSLLNKEKHREDRLYSLSMQFFPLTKLPEESSE